MQTSIKLESWSDCPTWWKNLVLHCDVEVIPNVEMHISTLRERVENYLLIHGVTIIWEMTSTVLVADEDKLCWVILQWS